jgi:hypothetical protein
MVVVRLPCSPNERRGGLVSPCARRPRHTRSEGVRAVDLLCSPNAHTRPIVLLDSRCSSKRAVGDQISPRPKREQASLEGAFKHARLD